MFGLLTKKKPYEKEAAKIYSSCLLKVREPFFYEQYSVPDTMDARFDLLLIHVHLVMARALNDETFNAEDFNQALFDIMFEDMDQTLREMGIGDMGVPKRMKKMMKGFNGRMHTYSETLATKSNTQLEAALARNVYNSEEPDKDIKKQAKALAKYVKQCEQTLANTSVDDMLNKAEALFK